MKVFAAAAAGLLSVSLATPAHAIGPEWTQAGYGPGQTFYNPDEPVVNGDSIGRVALRWTASLPTTEESCSDPSEPLVSAGRVFITDRTGIGAYRVTTGARLWHYRWSLPDNENTPDLAVSGGLLIAANVECQSASDPNGGVVALDVATGRQRWSAGGGPVDSLVVDRGVVVVAGSSDSSDPSVDGYRLSDGRALWSVGGYWSPGVSAGGRLMVSRSDGDGVAALAIATGRRLWSRPWSMTPMAANPAGDNVYLDDGDGGLFCMRASDGARIWWINGTGGSIASDGKRVYRGLSSSIEAVDARTGRRLWITKVTGGPSQPVRAGGLLYTNAPGKALTVLSAATGLRAAIWRFGSGDQDPVVAAGRIFKVNGDVLRAYAPI